MPQLPDQISDCLPAEFWQQRSVVAVSGGSDSMALLLALHQAATTRATTGFQLHVAHFDHQWSSESLAAVHLVQSTCKELGICCHVHDASTVIQEQCLEVSGRPPRIEKLGIEATARRLRYLFLENLVQQLSAKYLLTGHNRNDQVETVLMRIARGTSVSGLIGIKNQRSLTHSCELLRPLLSFDRKDLLDYLSQLGQTHWTDHSNDNNELTRNRTRNLVLPWLRQNLSEVIDESILGLQQSAQDTQELQKFVARQLRSAVRTLGQQYLEVDVSILAEVPEAVVRQLLVDWWQQANFPMMEMNRQQWIRLTTLALRPRGDRITQWPSQFHFPGPILAYRSQKILTVQPLESFDLSKKNTSAN